MAVVYGLVVAGATAGGSLLLLSVLLSPALRIASNIAIVSLALSDLGLVLVACPATLAQLAASHWPLPGNRDDIMRVL